MLSPVYAVEACLVCLNACCLFCFNNRGVSVCTSSSSTQKASAHTFCKKFNCENQQIYYA